MYGKTLFSFLLLANSVFAQDKKRLPNIALSPGVIFQGQTFGELNLLVGRYESTTGGNGLAGLRLGIESNFKKGDEFIFAPKLGFEVSAMVICLRGTALCYVQSGKTELRLLPEAGLSFLGFANLTYGYNFRVSRSITDGISNHRIALSVNLNRDLIGDIFH